MIRKIICPSDLSPAAHNAAAYAAKLCQLTGATMELIHSEPLTVFERVFASRRAIENTLTWAQKLNEQANEVNKMFHVSCSADVDTYNVALPELIRRRSNSETLIVLGTNGADPGHQQFFGSNAFNLAMAACGNLLVVPEHVSYRTITKTALAWDYHLPEGVMDSVAVFAADIKSKLLLVHISRHATLISKDVYRARRMAIEEETGREGEIEFQRVTASDIQQGLREFMENNVADLLVVPMKNGQLIRHFFGALGVPEHLPGFPILIISK